MDIESKFSAAFRAKQVAGSLRLSGISVSAADEKWMLEIVSGQRDAGSMRREMVEEIRRRNGV